MRWIKTSSVFALAAALAFAPAIRPALAGPDGDFYKGKTITYIVATKPGGGYDTYARLIAEFLERHLPGTEILVKNVPSAGHIIGANKLYVAEPDGLTIGTFNTGLIYAQLLGREGVRFDLRNLGWIGAAARDARVAVLGKDGKYRTVADLRRAPGPILFGTSGIGSAAHTETVLLARALRLNLKPVVGYSGDGAQMGLLRGELAGAVGSYSSYRSFLDSGFGRIVFRIGGEREIGAGVPDARDLVEDRTGKALIALIRSQSQLGRLTAAPPGVPPARLQVLRDAYRRALEDPDLLARAEKLKIPIDPQFGEDLAQRVAAALNQDTTTRQLLASVMNQKLPTIAVTAALVAVGANGKTVEIDNGGHDLQIRISGSRTRVSIGGGAADRADLRTGMVCALEYAPAGRNEATRIDCAR